MRRLALVVLLFLLWAPGAYAWSWPVQGPVLLGFTFDPSHPYAGGQHRGIDVGAPTGTPVAAPASGTISFAGTVPTSGKSVTIETADGYSVTLTHLGSIGVSKGASVGEGSTVGHRRAERDARARRAVRVHGRARDGERAGLSRSALVPAGAPTARGRFDACAAAHAVAGAGRRSAAGDDHDADGDDAGHRHDPRGDRPAAAATTTTASDTTSSDTTSSDTTTDAADTTEPPVSDTTTDAPAPPPEAASGAGDVSAPDTSGPADTPVPDTTADAPAPPPQEATSAPASEPARHDGPGRRRKHVDAGRERELLRQREHRRRASARRAEGSALAAARRASGSPRRRRTPP